MTIDISQFFQVFFDEAEELLAEKERLLLAVDIAAPDAEDLNAIFRTAHSIKGGASTFGLSDMSEVTHVLESLLDRIRQGQMALTAEHVDAFLAAKDILKMQLDGHRLGTPVDQDAVANIRMMLQSFSQDVPVAALTPVAPAFHTAEKETVSHAGGQRYRLELPKMEQREVDALAAELGLLGDVVVSSLPDARSVLNVTTHESLDDILAICSFVLNPDDMVITQSPPLAPGEADAAQVARAAQENAQGYGFFDPLPGAPAVKSEAEQGYGFFQPLEEIRAAAQGEPTDAQRGYGFFQPLEQIRADAAKASSANAAAVVTAAAVDAEQEKKPAKKDSDKAGAESSSIRVSIEKVDQLINLVGELVITQAMIEQRASGLDPMLHEKLLDSVSHLTRNTRDLQEAVMSIRMMPMDFVFSRFPRMVRDLATKLGKKVDFITNGAATELDKGLIERIVDPLTHLVRNSIDHGVEMPAARVAAGKTEAGRLFLSASHQGGNIIIEVSDDGAGLNRERILAKALQQGMDVSESMSDADVWQLIFAPGFSTAEAVTDVSGRGVGMDVVKRNISAMGGVVDIRSAKGFGTTISISLPLTLAILDGMSIRVGDEVYILPLGFVIESLQPAVDDIRDIAGRGQVVKVRGEYLPLIPLYQMFDITPRFTAPSEGICVILETEGRKAALFVDDLVGQQQVVVKNLESNYRKVVGISGATILGDGGVSLILDVAALIRSSRQLADESLFVTQIDSR
ncbi:MULTISPECIES: chemotaxis protein CheA [unclassified Janthinobacterium]|uniref:chemotaxis protein CheA n=1 Tax=unclassified Janthinobacterium TaxID=2610881 RepID=UPI00160CC9AF|nr:MULTISPECIES: chemotaxis protein CheA [unclassified Janthinobacterium]MBB5369107.1 two-component system chemotaxis sensor kinase CheA [Janthinobacterium sp. K2C7]MBB5381356.1 two-component system chemotaxis sensor kinase CheA [Janthinobacterium sp. K2Li3]MBB5387490.1 two-component system chemotaxis sensor kinase CheA [Janthinobacterium sp. K2E3]